MTDQKAEAIRIVRQALANLEDPERDAQTEISRLHGLLGLIKKSNPPPPPAQTRSIIF